MLLLAAAIPMLYWDAAPDTAAALRDAGIRNIAVAPARLAGWKDLAGVAAVAVDPASAIKLPAPTVNYRINEATATRAPWLVANGWKYVRKPSAQFYVEAPGKQSALAAAEAFCYGAHAVVHTDAAGLKPLAEMLNFLRGIGGDDLPAVADIGYIDDDSAASGEVMNLLVRDNLLFRLVKEPDRNLRLNVKLGTPEYPLTDARNPNTIAHLVRTNLTDEKRSVRIYGSAVVVARLTGEGGKARLHLLNYGGADRNVQGIRVRVLGRFPTHRLALAGAPGAELLDYSVEPDATEFTLPELRTYAVIDLTR